MSDIIIEFISNDLNEVQSFSNHSVSVERLNPINLYKSKTYKPNIYLKRVLTNVSPPFRMGLHRVTTFNSPNSNMNILFSNLRLNKYLLNRDISSSVKIIRSSTWVNKESSKQFEFKPNKQNTNKNRINMSKTHDYYKNKEGIFPLILRNHSVKCKNTFFKNISFCVFSPHNRVE